MAANSANDLISDKKSKIGAHEIKIKRSSLLHEWDHIMRNNIRYIVDPGFAYEFDKDRLELSQKGIIIPFANSPASSIDMEKEETAVF